MITPKITGPKAAPTPGIHATASPTPTIVHIAVVNAPLKPEPSKLIM